MVTLNKVVTLDFFDRHNISMTFTALAVMSMISQLPHPAEASIFVVWNLVTSLTIEHFLNLRFQSGKEGYFIAKAWAVGLQVLLSMISLAIFYLVVE
ncbi:hypothetical protein FC85_GL000086 [Lentilactobacillus diolivorans DSM 14421]|uniref:Uncharacterized protein n=1 Tax=Lentilactobacillus diolivorans DSM 14421 TaxID=1423739 RepID=A0A0R1S955_9LACO|nr:hypothetical protein FC85_GL000086 [Lentilactobacillus diolivorans DSM 14421]